MIGAARAFASPSVDSLLPQLIPRRDLANAQAWLASSGQLASIGGPPLGGLLIAVFGVATWTYLFAAGAGLLFVALLATIPPIAAAARPPRAPGDATCSPGSASSGAARSSWPR